MSKFQQKSFSVAYTGKAYSAGWERTFGNADRRDIIKAHDSASYHRVELEVSTVCGCFYCLRMFPPSEILEWIDGQQTAICPFCGIDSVLGDASLPITEEFLKAMEQHWFSHHRCPTGEIK